MTPASTFRTAIIAALNAGIDAGMTTAEACDGLSLATADMLMLAGALTPRDRIAIAYSDLLRNAHVQVANEWKAASAARVAAEAKVYKSGTARRLRGRR